MTEPARDLTFAEAREEVDTIKTLVDDVWSRVVTCYRGRAWLALGYASWDELCDRELGGARIRLPREERREVVGSLRDAGMSHRAIAAATGLARNTVADQLAQFEPVAQGSTNETDEATSTVTGLDGRQRPRSRQVAPEPLASLPAPESLPPIPPEPTLDPTHTQVRAFAAFGTSTAHLRSCLRLLMAAGGLPSEGGLVGSGLAGLDNFRERVAGHRELLDSLEILLEGGGNLDGELARLLEG